MPLVHSLNKISKNLTKKKGSLHIKGRKFKQLNRATLRDQKLNERKAKNLELKEKKDLLIIKFMQEAVKNRAESTTFELEDIKLFIESFISRNDEELQELRDARRPGRPATSRQQLLEEAIKHEKHLYDTGIKVPDLTDAQTVEKLRNWNGTIGGATILKYIYVSKNSKKSDQEME